MRDPSSGWIQLSDVEFFLLWSAMRLGPPPPVLALRHVGRTSAARASLIESASSSLAARELGSVAEPARDLRLLLGSLADPRVSLDLSVHGNGTPLFGFAALGGAAVARVGDEVRIGPGGSASSLLGALNPLPAGPERPANVAVADYTRACAEGARDGVSGFLRVLRDAGMRAPEAATVSRVVASRLGGGQLGASGRGRQVITWVDTPEGRYALRSDSRWLTVTPVDLPRLTAMAEELLAAV